MPTHPGRLGSADRPARSARGSSEEHFLHPTLEWTDEEPCPYPSREEAVLRADPAAQQTLLELQEVDSSLDQLRHRLETLPEHAALAALAARRADVQGRHGDAVTAVEDLTREQRKADADVEQVRARRARDLERIDSGLVGDPRQLQAMQHEVGALDKRIGDLEDVELAVMERLEAAQASITGLASELAEIDAGLAAAEASRDAAGGDISAEADRLQVRRGELAAGVPDDLLTLYDKLRAQLGGVGAGALRQRRCGGCRLDLGALELARIARAAADEVLRCEECNRILVRTEPEG